MIDGTRLSDLFKSDSRKGQQIFPELIKKLVIASANIEFDYLRFPSGNDIWVSGFDGHITDVKKGDQYLPKGNSIWEFGTSQYYKSKINEDYKKRTEEAVLFEKEEYSFMLCTPHIYDKDLITRQNQMNSESIWKEVRIYDGVILSDWLKQHLEVLIWLYKQFDDNNLKIPNIQRSDYFLNSYKTITNPSFTTELILTSQNNNDGNQIKELIDKLILKETGVHILFSPVSLEHGVLFSTAALSTNEALDEKTLIASDIDSVIFAENNFKKKIIIANFYWDGTNYNLRNNIYIFVTNNNELYKDQSLNNVRFNDFSKAIEGLGFDSGQATNITSKCNRNISCFKRMYAKENIDKNPSWAKDTSRGLLIPLALVSDFNLQFPGDLDIVNSLYGSNNYVKNLNDTSNLSEMPFIAINDIYKINYKEESLFVLGISSRTPEIKLLEGLFVNILKEPDPIYLKDVSNWHYRTENHKYSRQLISGIIETFIIIALKDKGLQNHYDYFIEKILLDSLNGFSVLNTVTEYLSLLAELSPKAVISFINKAIDEDNDNFRKAIESEYGGSVYLEKSKFYDYKFAIDKCLYFKDSAPEALRLIFKMFNSNYKTPKNFNFKEYVLESFSQFTSFIIPVKSRDKFELLKSLIDEKNSHKSMFIFEGFINGKLTNYMYGSPIYKYRENPIKEDFNVKDMMSLSHDAILYLLEHDLKQIELYRKLFDHLSFIEKITINYIFDSIYKNNLIDDEDFRLEINFILLDKIYNIKRFVDYSENNSWSYQSEFLTELIELYNFTTPKDLYNKHKYLFTHHFYDIPYLNPLPWNSKDSQPGYFEDEENKRSQLLRDALEELYSSDIENLTDRIINDSVDEGNKGQILSNYSRDSSIDIPILLKHKKINLMTGYLSNRTAVDLRDIFENLNDSNKKMLINGLGLNHEHYSVIENTNYEDYYWKNVQYFYALENTDFEKLAINKLLDINPLALIDYFTYGKKVNLSDKRLLLEKLVLSPGVGDHINQSKIYNIRTLVKQLDNSIYDEKWIMTQISLLGYLISPHEGYPFGVKKFFLEKPLVLLEFLKSCSKAEIGGNTIASKIKTDCIIPFGNQTIVSISEIKEDLNNTMLFNQKAEQGLVQESQLEKWVYTLLKAIENESNNELIYMVEGLIIHVLSLTFSFEVLSPENYIVAKLLEEMGRNKSQDYKRSLSSKFYSSKFNSLGVRSVGDGSAEKELADKYFKLANNYKVMYPITYEALIMMSNSFKASSERDKTREILGRYDYF